MSKQVYQMLKPLRFVREVQRAQKNSLNAQFRDSKIKPIPKSSQVQVNSEGFQNIPRTPERVQVELEFLVPVAVICKPSCTLESLENFNRD